MRLNESFDREDVSVFGQSAIAITTVTPAVATMHASNVVLESDVAVRAFAKSTSVNRGPALDNRLQAERDLLISVGE